MKKRSKTSFTHPWHDFSVPSRKPPKDRTTGIAEVENNESENLPSTQNPTYLLTIPMMFQ